MTCYVFHYNICKKKIQMDLIIFDVRLEGHVTGQGYEK